MGPNECRPAPGDLWAQCEYVGGPVVAVWRYNGHSWDRAPDEWAEAFRLLPLPEPPSWGQSA